MTGHFHPSTPLQILSGRCITTTNNSGDSVAQDATDKVCDVAPHIKFKRLDKTAKHIMQACIFITLIVTDGHIILSSLIFGFLFCIFYMTLQILDKEAVEEVRKQRERPDIKPGYIIQLKVV